MKLSKTLEYRHLSKGAETALNFIDARRKGLAPSLKTSYKKLNSVLLDGIDWYRIFTIAGLSGSGKSTILETLKRDFVELNPQEKFKILSFEFEMRIEDQLTRGLSSQLNRSVKELYSAEKSLEDEEFEEVAHLLSKTENSPIYYVDDVGEVPEIISTIDKFVADMKLVENEEGLVVTIDHVLLTKERQGEDEKKKIDALMHQLVALKKQYSSKGLRCIFIVLSQLNRDIQYGERVTNRKLHYPTRNDLFAASSVYYCSDYVLITHNPSTIEGLGPGYGRKNLPIRYPGDDTRAMLYWHVIKERFGETKILTMVEHFRYSRIDEFDYGNS